MKRKIIKIDEAKCNGCGLCAQGCPEGALQIIDGKARLVGELLCDGLGACIGQCPEGAIAIEEREAEPYREEEVMANIVKQGPQVLTAHLKHLIDHHQDAYYRQAVQYLEAHGLPVPASGKPAGPPHAGCPGMMMKDFRKESPASASPGPAQPLVSRLGQWPIQLQLLNPQAPYFRDADLVIAADCVPFAHANFHERFLKGRILIILCPKLDRVADMYVEKFKAIFEHNNIRSVTLVHMEVPCCFGIMSLLQEALQGIGKNVVIKEYTISLQGEIV